MPEISIDTSRNSHGYALKAEDIFWCFQGILRTSDLRESDDEQALADICASILSADPVEASGDFLNRVYSKEYPEYVEFNAHLAAYGRDTLSDQVKSAISAIRSAIELHDDSRFAFRKLVYPKATSNAQKSPFYAVFMAFFELMYKEEMRPAIGVDIMASLENVTNKIEIGQKHIKSEDRTSNIKIVKGLIRDHFVKVDAATLGHGPGLVIDFENSIRRSRTETPRYEFKQGILRLETSKAPDPGILSVIIETICGIANVGPEADGFIYLGIADKDADAARVEALYGVASVKFDHVSIVGIERESKQMGIALDKYMRNIEEGIRQSSLSDPLKTQVLSNLDVVTYKGRSVARIRVPRQSQISFVGDHCFVRVGSSTHKAKAPQIAAVTGSFQKG
jgi:Putative DNA-binding domain